MLTNNAVRVLEARYLKKIDGKVAETPDDLFKRVARTVASAEQAFQVSHQNSHECLTGFWENRFYELMATGVFMPNSPTLMNAGRPMGMLSACFVLPVEDSIESIFQTLKDTALIQKAGGGTGFDFSKLRPKNDTIQSSGGTSPGPLAFLQLFSHATNAIQQGAFRRGANMGVLRIDHPDILDFIDFKQDLSRINNFNISVAITNEFMDRLAESPHSNHKVVNPRTGQVTSLAKTTQEIFQMICQNAWRTGEPGIIFIDRINQDNPTPQLGAMSATNPCGEQPLLPNEACNLASINVSVFAQEGVFDWGLLEGVIHDGVRFLDNAIEVNHYPTPAIARICQGNRKIGLGIMGFADLLFKLGIPYDSQESVRFAEDLMDFFQKSAHQASTTLASERGVFPNWYGSRWRDKGVVIRNACVTTVAPTGTISIIAGCSPGIEPVFSLAFERNVSTGRMFEVNPIFEQKIKALSQSSRNKILQHISTKGTLVGVEGVSVEDKRIFRSAQEISPHWHLQIQAAFQRHCDSGISKTINLPEMANADDVQETFLQAYALGLKGVTIYRNRSREQQPMALIQKKE